LTLQNIVIVILSYLYIIDIWICGGRARPQGPGGGMKHQFHLYIWTYS
jgi:hypothetical protein